MATIFVGLMTLKELAEADAVLEKEFIEDVWADMISRLPVDKVMSAVLFPKSDGNLLHDLQAMRYRLNREFIGE